MACGFNLDIYCPSCHNYHTFESSSTAAQQSVIAAFSAGMTYVEYQRLFAALDLQPVSNTTFFKRQMLAARAITTLLDQEVV